jgi:hypothetical protein
MAQLASHCRRPPASHRIKVPDIGRTCRISKAHQNHSATKRLHARPIFTSQSERVEYSACSYHAASMLSMNNIVYPTSWWLAAANLFQPETRELRGGNGLGAGTIKRLIVREGPISLKTRRARLDNMIRRPLTIGATKAEALSLGATVLERDALSTRNSDRAQSERRRSSAGARDHNIVGHVTFVQSSSKASMPCR